MGKGRLKYNVKLLGIIVSLMIVSITACQSQAPAAAKQEKKTEKSVENIQDKSVHKKEEQSIPKDLFPAGEDAMEASEEASLDMNSLDEVETEYGGNVNTERKSAGGTSGNTSSSGGYQGSEGTVPDEINVSFDVESSTAEQYGYAVYYFASLTMKRGATVYDALASSGVDYSGKSYITSIGGLSEKTGVGTAGWKYYVNGKEPGVSCDKYTLKDGDTIQWSYVLKP